VVSCRGLWLEQSSFSTSGPESLIAKSLSTPDSVAVRMKINRGG
jgi:hypothetical protein